MRWKVQGLALLAMISAGGTVEAQEAGGQPMLYDDSGALIDELPRHWEVRPTPRTSDFTREFLSSGWPGSARLACAVQADGSLTQCRAEAQSPRGYGVGRSAATIAQRGRLVGPFAATTDGKRPIVRFTINFPVAR
jgi:hypothetical protein